MVKYGMEWFDRTDLEIELECISRGGVNGSSLFEHYMEARKLVWPDRYRHRWTELMYHNFLENDVTVLMGGASTQKTSHAVEFAILNYWARPENTMVILSTINMDKLDIGVYAELKMLWQSGHERFDFLSGHLIEHKRAITTDDIEFTARDFRKGVICFPGGTLVDTPGGSKPIETMKVGDMVKNAIGHGRIRKTMSRIANRLVRVFFNDGRHIDCTPEHPIFTSRGWINAIDLATSDKVLSADEALHILRKRHVCTLPKSEVLFNRMLKKENRLQAVRKERVSGEPRKEHSGFLLTEMRGVMEEGALLHTEPKVRLLREGVCWSPQSRLLLFTMPGLSSSDKLSELRHIISSSEDDSNDSVLRSILRCELEPSKEINDKEEADSADRCGDGDLELVSERLPVELFGNPEHVQEGRSEKVGEDRHCFSRYQIGHRARWTLPPASEGCVAGQTSGQGTSGTRVDHVEILEPRGDGRYSQSEGGYRVYNIEVEGHPSYSVNGCLVHNCRPCYVGGKWVGLGTLAGTKQDYIIYVADELQFMQESFSKSWPHLFANGNVKIIGSGNPKHDPYDELGVTAEPECGWNSLPEPSVTTTWKTKNMGGVCVNLVGTDSPNFDFPPDQPTHYKRLMSRSFAERIEHDNEAGKESFEYYRLVKGVMKVSFAKDRVIDRPLCVKHNAMLKAVWKDDSRIGVYGLDPTYGGDDRCVGIPLWFGMGTDGVVILDVGMYEVFPLNMARIDKESAEMQVARILKERLEFHKIPANNAFYDATGKGTLGGAFTLIFGSVCPVPIDSGAQPTDRPVRQGLYVDDPNGGRRLKLCREHYSKFITEMWFSVRYAVEAGQVRGLHEDIIKEGSARIYYITKGNKIEVEPKTDPKKKEDLKRRLGKSPDLFDSLVIGVEGARQRGFNIARLVSQSDEDDSFSWLTERASGFRNLLRSKQLATR